ncbi:MAG TPA: hypothetical protein VGM51_01835 [Armatimonadota bacterium]|jgi:hypothetical protein
MDTKPWYSRPALVVAALIFLPPLGIWLAWARTKWSPGAKLAATLLSGALFLQETGAFRHKDSHSGAQEPKPAAVAAPANVPPRSPPPTESGDALATQDPRLLAPPNFAGFKLALAERTQGSSAIRATYDAADEASSLVLRFFAEKQPAPLPPPDKTYKLAKVGDREARVTDGAKEKRGGIEWREGDWSFEVTISYRKPGERDEAKRLLPGAAEAAEKWVGQFLVAERAPVQAFRQDHLARLEAVTAATNRREEEARLTQKKRASLITLKQRLEKAGVSNRTLVSIATSELDADELVVTVAPGWDASTKPTRLRVAQNLWRMWAQLNTPNDLDKSHIKVMDENNNKKASSGIMGSSVSLEE